MCLLAGLKQANDRGEWPKPIPAPLGDSPARKLGKELVDNVQQARLIQRSSFSFKGTANLRISRCTPIFSDRGAGSAVGVPGEEGMDDEGEAGSASSEPVHHPGLQGGVRAGN